MSSILRKICLEFRIKLLESNGISVFKMSDAEIPSKEEIIKNMAKRLQTHPEDGEEVLLRTYDLAFIKGKIEGANTKEDST